MIRKVKGGYVVVSHKTGKRLSKVYKSRKQAKKRLKEIGWFKYIKKK